MAAMFAFALLATQASMPTIVVPKSAALPVRIERMVVIGKAKFKVRVRGNIAEVRRKNIAYNMNSHHFEMTRQAAELASGCKALDQSQQQDGLVVGAMFVRLDCAVDSTTPK